MMLYSASLGVRSHSVRIVLLEKEVECRVEYVDSEGAPGDLVELNPYNETPTLVDRDLVLYGCQIINEYLDERLPHPPLMPVDPVNRGRARLMMLRVQRDWLDLVKDFDSVELVRENEDARQMIRDGLIAVSPIFNEQAYMLGEEFSLVDCLMAPLLWRLPVYGINLPRQAKPILEYGERLFERASFLSSLSEAEHEIR
ncbi:MAG: stringent starvation protein A [Gammaproteobacteria bacterium]|nr:stringent starvation protein A [Gammaproteobacteria bacterium]